ncbi:hypothetical protein [Acidihalobacter ferrooxydans]|uniref:Uncharacterized protein n=1 Tax=Acidihalobacter ferrooxydans TaxID=1765967 RepID=A0A1P8UED0_9GAMM|nr:hypothetical protein [Acidihalobacter ferrooxydans]APZ42203.1 hypothetical protein BW247_03095 [Acidihalobacter ferrooxydans]
MRSGLRRYLRLVAKPIAGFGDVQVLDAVADYLRMARLLHRASSATLRAGLCTALHRAAAMDDAGQVHELAICARSLARRSGPGQRTLGSEDAAVIWLYGVRAAWLWRAAGGGRSPFLRVSRASLKAAEQLLGQEPVGLGES